MVKCLRQIFCHYANSYLIRHGNSCWSCPRLQPSKHRSNLSKAANTWWRHQMETFSAFLAFCAGNSPVPVNSPHKGQWREALMFPLICARTNRWINNHEAGDLRRHEAHYDVSVMNVQRSRARPPEIPRQYIYIYYNFVWRRHEDVPPCTGSRVNTTYERIELLTPESQGHWCATHCWIQRANHSTMTYLW